MYHSNILYGSKTLSSFEVARGYTPPLVGLPQAKLSADLITVHNEQVARRALRLLDKSRSLQVLHPEELLRDDPVYYFKRGPKFGSWETAYARKPQPHFAVLSRRQDHIGKPIRAAHKDVRPAPSSSLLAELDVIDSVFPQPYSVIDEDFEEGMFPLTSAPTPLFEELQDTHDFGSNLQPTGKDVPHV